MNIALYHNLPSGGARRAMVEMVKGLAARGHIIDEYCLETADRSFLPLEPYVKRTISLPYQPTGVWQRRIPLVTPYITAIRLSRDMAKLASVNKQAACQINAGQYDVVFSHDCQFAQNPDILRYLTIPAVHYYHHGGRSRMQIPARDNTSESFKKYLGRIYYGLPNAIYPWLRERQAEENIRAASLILTNSYFARERLYCAYGVDSQVCYLGVDTASFRPLHLPRKPFVLSVGAVHYFKGYRFLLEALRLIPATKRPALLIAANSSETTERQHLEELAVLYGIDLSIRQVNDDEALLELYNNAAAFVYTPIMEPWGLAAIEAMACGTPVVAVREGGLRESILHGETGLTVERNEEQFASALTCLLENPSFAHQLGQAGAEHVQRHYTWECTIAHLEMIFSSTTGATDAR